MPSKLRIPQAAGMRRSVEFQHGKRGVGRMLRRGLHGAKNWVLEPEEDGTPRSGGAKTLRAVVVSAPVWLVVSAVTGGPQRGGSEVGMGRAVLMALLVCAVGLAWFSARERRQGREEPWASLVTDGDNAGESAATDTAEERSVVSLEKTQVIDLSPDENGETGDNISPETADSTQIDSADLHGDSQRTILENSETVVVSASEGPTEVLHAPVQQVTSEGANPVIPPVPSEAPRKALFDQETEVLRTAIPDEVFDQFSEDDGALREGVEKATSAWTDVDVSGDTESDDGLLLDQPTTPLRSALQEDLREGVDASPSAQVSLLEGPLPQGLQGALQVEYAEQGPYEAKPDMLAEDWWLVKPDVTQEEEPEEASVPEADGREEPTPQEEARTGDAFGRYPQVVVTYMASTSAKSAFTQEEKDAARRDVIGWLRTSTEAGHVSRAEASRMLGVNASTVKRWLDGNDDPWAEAGEPE